MPLAALPNPSRGERVPQRANADRDCWGKRALSKRSASARGCRRSLNRKHRSNPRPHDRHHRPAATAENRHTRLHRRQCRCRDEFEQQMQQGDHPLAIRMQEAEVACPPIDPPPSPAVFRSVDERAHIFRTGGHRVAATRSRSRCSATAAWSTAAANAQAVVATLSERVRFQVKEDNAMPRIARPGEAFVLEPDAWRVGSRRYPNSKTSENTLPRLCALHCPRIRCRQSDWKCGQA